MKTIFLQLILAYTVLVHTITKAEEETCTTSYHNNVFEDSFCCNGETLTLGHDPVKYFQECSAIPPTDDSMSFQDSHWTLYECIATKTVGSSPLTLDNYVEMMTRNFSAEKKTTLLALLKSAGAVKENLGSGVDLMKQLWKIYFDAEFQMCKKVTKDEMEKMVAADEYNERRFWEPATACNGNDNALYPAIHFRSYGSTVDECPEKFAEKMKLDVNFTQNHLMGGIYTVCTLMEENRLKESDLTVKLNSETILNVVMIPKYLSKSIKDKLVKLVPTQLTNMFHINVESLSTMTQVIEKLEQNAERILKDFNIEPSIIYTNLFILDQLDQSCYYAIYKAC